MPWRVIRDVLRNAAVQAAARILAGLLALLGGATVVDPQVAVDLRNAALGQAPEVVGKQ